MGKSYAGILGCLAFSTTLIRSSITSTAADDAFLTATLALFAFAALGWLVGAFAEALVVQATRSRFAAELAAAREESPDTRGGSS